MAAAAAYGDELKIHTGARFTVARARRADGIAVVLKRARSDHADARSAERLQHEYELLRLLDMPGVPRALDLATIDGSPVLVLADAGPRCLAELLGQAPLPIGRFLELALSMAEIVRTLHERGVIHRDICPQNFVVGHDGAALTLVDFESATAVPAFAQAPGVPGDLEGSLAYVPPEQTGRMSRLVDRRADLYALGATFYEMLTGRPPFPSRDPLEVVHAHAARAPDAPALVNSQVPTAISDIVLKLLAKMPEWRYQTAGALAADLAEARRQWQERSEVDRFALARQDLPYGLFLPPGKLYGRERERDELAQAVERVVGGAAELVLVSGPAGVGKSALVNDLGGVIGERCRLLVGKCEPFHANVPYAPLVEALRGVVQSCARAPEPMLPKLRAALTQAVAPNACVLTDAIPDLRALLGEPPPVAEVDAVEAENRFHLAFGALVRALVEAGGPLVLFIDDLQWIDLASLELLRTLASDPAMRSLLVLCAYRSEEVGAGHPVAQTIELIRAAGGPVRTVELGPLDGDALLALLCDALTTSPERAAPLAEAVRRKTAGNPFFVRQFLGYVYRRKLLFGGVEEPWSWDLDGIEAAEVTPNVVDLLAKVIELLPAETQAALGTAACIGNRFELGVLAGVAGKSLDGMARTLWPPIEQGLLVPAIEGPRFAWARTPVELERAAAPTYRFVHDRIQQAAYQRLTDDERKRRHLDVGRWLEANAPAADLDAAIGPLVDQLDRAAERLPDGERLHVAELNERAARQARASSAYASALRYCQVGLSLLPARAWSCHLHGLWYALQRNAAECAGLVGDHQLSERLLDEGLQRSSEPLEKAELQAIGVRMNALAGAHEQAIARGLDGLRLFGVTLCREPSPKMVHDEKARLRAILGARTERQLLDAPAMKDPAARAELRILASLASAWFTAPQLFKVVAFRAAALTAERGLVPSARGSAAAYAFLGVALAMEGDYQEAYQYGALATKLAERFVNPALESRVLLCFGGHVSPWRAPLSESVPILQRSYARGMESGEFEFAAYALANLVFLRTMLGVPLDQMLVEASAALSVYRRVRHLSGIPYVQPFVQAARCLKGLTRSGSFDDDAFDEARFVEENARNGLGQAMFHVLHVQTSLLLGRAERAVEWAAKAERWLPYLRTLPYRVELHFHVALALVDQGAQRGRIGEQLARLEAWAAETPANYAHKRDLVAAEVARLEERPADALALYHRAIEAAGAGGFVQDEAMAHERCGRFHAARGAERMAAVHLSGAVDGYARWGADAKVKLLRAEFPTLELGGRLRRVTSPPAPMPQLDYLSLLKVAEALTEELVFERLLEKLIGFCTEAADAQRGCLVLDDRGLVVRALASGGEVSLEKTPLGASGTLPRSLVGHVFRSREPLLLGDAARHPHFAADPYVAEHGVRSVLAVPICRHERTLGVLYFENNLASDAFPPERGEMFRLLSAELAIALENSRLFAARQRSEARLHILADASASLGATIDYEHVVATIGAVTVPTLADWCMVEACEHGRTRPIAMAHVDPRRLAALAELQRRYPAGSASPLRGDVLRAGKSLLVADVTAERLRSLVRDADNLTLLQALEPRSLMVVPLAARGRTFAVATFGSSQPSRSYDEADLALADELVRRIGLALDNARLHRDLQRTMQEREARDRYLQVIFRTMPGAVWALDRDLRFTYASGNFYGAVGFDPERLAGTTLYDFLQTRDPTDRSIAHHMGALAGRRQTFEYALRDHWYEARLEPLRGDDGQIAGIVGAAFDITEKRAAAERLAKSESRLWEAQAVAHIGSFEWDVAANTVTWTDELHRIYGLEPGEFDGTFEAFLSMVYPDEVEATKNVVFDSYRSARPFTYDHHIVRKDGAVRVLHTRGDVIKDESGNPVRMVGTCWDVTDLAEANRARERNMSLLRATIEATADGIIVVDRDRRLSIYNQRFCSLWRLPSALADRGQLDPLVDAMLGQVEDPDEFLRGLRERHAHPDNEGIDVIRLRDGRVFERYSRPQRIADAIVGTVWTFRDISDRERLLRRALFLADVSRLLVSLDLEQALDGVAHMAVPFLGDGCAIDLFGNGGPRRLVAISRDAKRPIAPELHPTVLGGNSIIYQVGAVSYLGVPLVMKGGLGGAITVCAPLHRKYGPSDLELVEELGRRASLSVASAQLYRQSQEALRARDEFLAIAAHEIRGPVTAIHLAVQSLQQRVLPKDALPRLLDVIEREDRRLSQFVNELLDLGRMRGGLRIDYEEVDLVAVVRAVTTRLGAEVSRSGSSLTVMAPGTVVGQWDKLRLDQVVTNLVSNAIKFGLGNPIDISVRVKDGRAVLVVKDRGIGIEHDVQKRIFLPFERGVSVRHYGGLGLGLHIVKTIVEALGGSVNVESEPGQGSTFTVVLPQRRT